MQKDHLYCPIVIQKNNNENVILGWMLNDELLVPCRKYPLGITKQETTGIAKYTNIYCKTPLKQKDLFKQEELYEDRGSLFYKFK